MPRQIRIPFLLIAALIAIAPVTAVAEPESDEQHGAVRFHRYVYYPTQQIYYSTEQQIWFWPNGGGWSYGVHLPADFRVRMGTGLPLRLGTDRPYTAHAEVEQRFGQPWRERQQTQQPEQDDAQQEANRNGVPDNG